MLLLVPSAHGTVRVNLKYVAIITLPLPGSEKSWVPTTFKQKKLWWEQSDGEAGVGR